MFVECANQIVLQAGNAALDSFMFVFSPLHSKYRTYPNAREGHDAKHKNVVHLHKFNLFLLKFGTDAWRWTVALKTKIKNEIVCVACRTACHVPLVFAPFGRDSIARLIEFCASRNSDAELSNSIFEHFKVQLICDVKCAPAFDVILNGSR